LWQEAITKCIPTCSNKLTYPLGMWMDSILDWHWQWNPLENCLAESTENGWRIWLPQQRNRGNRLRCQPTNLYMALNPHFEHAVVELHDQQVFFQGSRPGQPLQQPLHKDFVTTINTLEYAHWAFASYKTSDNGKQIANALLHGTCEVVSDGHTKMVLEWQPG